MMYPQFEKAEDTSINCQTGQVNQYQSLFGSNNLPQSKQNMNQKKFQPNR